MYPCSSPSYFFKQESKGYTHLLFQIYSSLFYYYLTLTLVMSCHNIILVGETFLLLDQSSYIMDSSLDCRSCPPMLYTIHMVALIIMAAFISI